MGLLMRNGRIIALSLYLLSFGLPIYSQDSTRTTAVQDTVPKVVKIELDSTQSLTPKLKELFTQAQTDNGNAALRFQIAQEYLKIGRKTYALKQIEESLTLDATNMDVQFAKAELLLEIGKHKSGYEALLVVLRDFKGQAYLDRIASRFASPYKITQLTNNKFNDVLPAFSPDGNSLVFQSDRTGNWDIYSMNLTQGETSTKRLTDDVEADENPSFSPDGRFIVFTSTRDDKSSKKYKAREIYYMDGAGKNVRKVTTSYGSDNWSPSFVDTTTILFASDRADFSNRPFWQKPSALFTIEKSGNFLFKSYGDEKSTFTDPSIKPGSGQIVFAEKKSENDYEIFVANMDGKDKPVNITNSAGNDLQPNVSKNGNFVAFVSDRDGNYEIYKMQIDGREQTRISYDDGDDIFPHFSPGGNKIAFCSNRTGNYQLYIASLEESSTASMSTVISILEKKASSATDN
jgi:TolB protein